MLYVCTIVSIIFLTKFGENLIKKIKKNKFLLRTAVILYYREKEWESKRVVRIIIVICIPNFEAIE